MRCVHEQLLLLCSELVGVLQEFNERVPYNVYKSMETYRANSTRAL